MRTFDLFSHPSIYSVIQERCSTFIRESQHQPLLKNLSNTYTDCHRVKVRKRKAQNSISSSFNEAFIDHGQNLQQRAIFANATLHKHQRSMDVFYVFPIDGYKFMYSKKVSDSNAAYQLASESLVEQLGMKNGKETLTELLRFSYTNENLAEGISSGSEIILYNIPFYYAVRVSSVPSYLSLVKK